IIRSPASAAAPARERPRNSRTANERDKLAAFHVWMAPAWQEIIWRAAQRSLAVMCPACWCSPGGLLALMGSANRVLIIQTRSMSGGNARLGAVAPDATDCATTRHPSRASSRPWLSGLTRRGHALVVLMPVHPPPADTRGFVG